MRPPGIEPGSNAWEASMITITLQALEEGLGYRVNAGAGSVAIGR